MQGIRNYPVQLIVYLEEATCSWKVHGTRRLLLFCRRHCYVMLGKSLNLPGPQFSFPREDKKIINCSVYLIDLF